MLSSALIFSALCSAAGPAVLVKHQEQFQGFIKQPRLAEVMLSFNTSPDLYWPAARFYKTDAADVRALEQQRQQLLEQLKLLQQLYIQDNEPELAASIDLVHQQIQSWQLAKQLLLPLDPDSIRVKPELNPKLLAGQYLLVLGQRPKAVQLIGFTKTKTLELLNAATATDYTNKIEPLAGASASFLYIAPAGSAAFVAQTGLWNSKRQDIAPGAVLFVPVEQALLPADFKDLNQLIIELAQHKVVLE